MTKDTKATEYFDSLPDDILTISIAWKEFKFLPDLTRFKNLKTLYCTGNLFTSLPTLPENLEVLYCANNLLTSLPTLPQTLKQLYCDGNCLTSLPTLPKKLIELGCYNNYYLTSLPTLPQNLIYFCYDHTPIYKIVNSPSMFQIKKNIQILNNFRHLYYSLKFKKQFKKWLWKKKEKNNYKIYIYKPQYLIEDLGDKGFMVWRQF